MYEDSWYSYVPESKKDDTPHSSKHRRRESLLKQPNGNSQPDQADSLIEIFEEDSRLKGPPEATLARRAKSYGDFYEAAISYLGKETGKEVPKQALEFSGNGENGAFFVSRYEEYENDLLNASHEEYQLYKDQLALSERHLDSLLADTTLALDLLAALSESFKAVESQTTAFQAQCEDLLAEQKRLSILADEIGTDLQYYAYLEPLTRRLNAPGAGRLVRNDDFLDMLTNLNTCIDFMDTHPQYRDSTIYKTRYTSLLERSLNLVQMAFTTAVKEVADEASKQLKAKDQNETTQYILLYGNYEGIIDTLGPQVVTLLKTAEYAFGSKAYISDQNPSMIIQYYHDLFRQLTTSYLKGREIVAPLVLKNLRQYACKDPRPDTDFELFARLCVQQVFDVCHNELNLIEKFFLGGPILEKYDGSFDAMALCADKLEQHRLSPIKILHTFLVPYLSNGDLRRVCQLVNWLETTYLTPVEMEDEQYNRPNIHQLSAQFLLSEHLWPLSDTLFIKSASELEHFKPSADDLKIERSPSEGLNKSNYSQSGTDVQIAHDPQTPTATVSNAYPTVKTAVSLLILYNESIYDRPKGNVLYEIVHQATESLQRAATTIKRATGILDAQVFLIKNLMLIENLFMTHEIPDSVRQSAELDFSPIWETVRELQARKQLFNPLAYINPLVQGQLLPAVVDKVLDARKELEKVLVQQITAFTKYWQTRLTKKGQRDDAVVKANKELEELLDKAFDETMKAGLWRMIRAEQSSY